MVKQRFETHRLSLHKLIALRKSNKFRKLLHSCSTDKYISLKSTKRSVISMSTCFECNWTTCIMHNSNINNTADDKRKVIGWKYMIHLFYVEVAYISGASIIAVMKWKQSENLTITGNHAVKPRTPGMSHQCSTNHWATTTWSTTNPHIVYSYNSSSTLHRSLDKLLRTPPYH